jgi:hypothetical protein
VVANVRGWLCSGFLYCYIADYAPMWSESMSLTIRCLLCVCVFKNARGSESLYSYCWLCSYVVISMRDCAPSQCPWMLPVVCVHCQECEGANVVISMRDCTVACCVCALSSMWGGQCRWETVHRVSVPDLQECEGVVMFWELVVLLLIMLQCSRRFDERLCTESNVPDWLPAVCVHHQQWSKPSLKNCCVHVAMDDCPTFVGTGTLSKGVCALASLGRMSYALAQCIKF